MRLAAARHGHGAGHGWRDRGFESAARQRRGREYNRRFGIDAGKLSPNGCTAGATTRSCAISSARELSADEVAAHGAAKEALYREMLDPGWRKRWCPACASSYERHAGLPVGLATNAEPANVDFILDRGGLRDLFPRHRGWPPGAACQAASGNLSARRRAAFGRAAELHRVRRFIFRRGSRGAGGRHPHRGPANHAS